MNPINEFILDNTSICHILFQQDEDFTFWHMVIPNTSTICAEWNSGNLSCSLQQSSRCILKFLNYPTNLSDFSNPVLHDTFLKFHPTTSIGGSFISDKWMHNSFSVFRQQILNFKKIKQCGLEFSRFSRVCSPKNSKLWTSHFSIRWLLWFLNWDSTTSGETFVDYFATLHRLLCALHSL
jgi:hypothetical protein